MDSANVAFDTECMTEETARQCSNEPWNGGTEGPGEYVHIFTEINAVTLRGSCVIWIVFPRSICLPPGTWAEGQYMTQLGETSKRASLTAEVKIKPRHR